LQEEAKEEASRVRIPGQEEVRQPSQGKAHAEAQMMRHAIPTTCGSLAGWRARCLLLAAVVIGAMAASTATAFGAPELAITMTRFNPFGAQASECHSGNPEPEAQPPCGINPLTEAKGEEGEGGEGKTFARESGGDTYTLKITNDGSGSTNGPVTVRDELPPGMVLVGRAPGESPNPISAGVEWECKVETKLESGRQVAGGAAKCTTNKPLGGSKSSYEPITLRLHVNQDAANPSTNVATVEGGEAAPASSSPAEGKTTITEAVPFGIDSFITSSVESLGNPFSQAGGHPFAFTTELTYNYTTADGAVLGVAGGTAKEVQVELPPGFVGNLENAPRCPLEQLKTCPANTAVGFVHVSTGGQIVGGIAKPALPPQAEFSGLVYNVKPTHGHVALLGFVVQKGILFLLDAKVRSGTDYGVTVGISPQPFEPRVLSVQLTTCENGAGGENPNFSCNPAPPSSKPFLTNPTECTSPEPGKTGAPLTTVQARPWFEPADSVAKTVGTNLMQGALSAESLMTGCESLQFHPELELKPSVPSEGGTTQADEPTGVTVGMKVPQTNEAAVNATPALKNLTMTLPAGMTSSPSAADGLQACTNAKFWPSQKEEQEEAEAKVPVEEAAEHREPAVAAKCPPKSQIGTVEVFTPLLSGTPKLEGVPRKGELLSCSEGMWSRGSWNASKKELEEEGFSLSYGWLRDGVAIAGATAREYVPASGDEGKALQCQVTASNVTGGSVAVSQDVVVLPESTTAPPFPPSSIARPGGTASVGDALSCANGGWTGEGVAFSYRWLRGGVAIAGAEGKEYSLTAEDAGKVIQCQVQATNAGGTAVADSASVVASPVPSPAPPLAGGSLQGQLFVGAPECSPCTEANHDAASGRLLRLFLQVQDPPAGVIVKSHGTSYPNEATGQLTTTFLGQPQQPFELLQLKLKGGPRAPLANPQSCGPARSTADLTPWSAPGLGGLSGAESIPGSEDATPSSQFEVDADGAGGPCPAAWPFAPSFNAGTTGPTSTAAGAFSEFEVTFSRRDREQDFSSVQVRMPQGISAKLASVAECGEAEVHEAETNTGGCPASSQIGVTTSGAGSGEHPLFLEGKVFLTGPYRGAPFGLAIVVPAVAGPFNLGNVVVRSAIAIDPHTAAGTVTSDPLPQVRDGVPFRLREVNVKIDRAGFIINPTNCSAQQVSATFSSAEGASAQASSPFGIAGCGSLPFSPTFTASTQAQTSKANGASLTVKVVAKPGQANIGKTTVFLPSVLPSRLTTIQKACVAAVFAANPAACPPESVVGIAMASTPVLKNPLSGPAYLVSYGNAKFPDIVFLLQGEGITLELDGQTDIKNGVTSSTFNALPDAQVSTFETVLPEGPHSALAAFGSLCAQNLIMPTTITGQNGAVIKQNTHIAVTGCPPTVNIAKIRVAGNALLVSVKTSAPGTVWISGRGLRTTHKTMTAGTHQLRVGLTKLGIKLRKHHRKMSVRVKLTIGRQAVTKAATVQL
jgi:hypothetical protein